jgi:hypothetical protein
VTSSKVESSVDRSLVETRAHFTRVGYAVVPRLLPDPARSFLYDYALKAAQRGQLEAGDDDVPGTPYRYADSFMESLLEILLPRISDASGLALDPTYSYVRVYKHGDMLKPHRDRPACEVSATVSLGYHADAPWPIWIDAQGAPTPVALAPGDAMLYRGIDLRHWREPFHGTRAVQVFLHYVDRNGDRRDWKFDRRPALAVSAAASRTMRLLMGEERRAKSDD